MKLVMRIVHLLVVLFMMLLAALQLNDPDPILWTGFYLLCAAPAALAIVGRSIFWLNAILLVLCVVVAALYVPGLLEYFRHATEEPLMQGMNDEKPYIEEAREFIGALIVLLLIAPYAVASRPRSR